MKYAKAFFSAILLTLVASASFALDQANGSYTGSATGFTTTPTCAFTYRVVDTLVTLTCAAGLTGTSNATSFTITGAPPAVRPTAARCRSTSATDTGGKVPAEVCIGTNGTLTFGMGAALATTGFTASGVKAIASGWSVTYNLR